MAKKESSSSTKASIEGEEEFRGTTIVAIKYRRGVVLAADTRVKSTDDKKFRDDWDKVRVVSERIVVAAARNLAEGEEAIGELIHQVQGKRSRVIKSYHGTISVRDVAKVLKAITLGKEDSEYVLVGWDPKDQSQIYHVEGGKLIEEGNFAYHGSGKKWIHTFFLSKVNQGAFEILKSLPEAKSIASQAVTDSCLRHNSSGGHSTTIAIVPRGPKSTEPKGKRRKTVSIENISA